MRTSQAGINLIKEFEGLELEAYQDIAGIWTIGYGHTGPDVTPGQVISEAEAEDLLRMDLVRFESAINSAVTKPITQNQFDAYASLAYNIGANALKKSTSVKRVNKGDNVGAAEAITWWNKATINGVRREVMGLTRRRTREAALFMTGINSIVDVLDDEPSDSTRVTPEGENSPRRGNVAGSRTIEGGAVAGAGGAASAGAAMVDDDGTPNDDQNPAPVDDTNPVDDSNSDSDNAEICVKNADGEIVNIDSFDEDVDTSEMVEVLCDQTPEEKGMDRHDYIELFQIIAGIITVLAVLYIIYARIDDWLNYRR